MIQLLDPTDGPKSQSLNLAERHTTLDGLTIGLIDNSKLNSDAVLDYAVKQLGRQFKLGKVVHFKKGSLSHAITDEEAEALAKECQLILSGVGD